jgi:hypothetical protein
MFGNPLPWKKSELTPNLGGIDETDDMRPGLGWSGVQNLENFVRRGGLLITANDTANFAVTMVLPAAFPSRRRNACGSQAASCVPKCWMRQARLCTAITTIWQSSAPTAQSST